MNDDLAGQIRRNLWAISDLYDETLEPVRRATGSHVTASKEPPLPISAHTLDGRTENHRDMAYWAWFILESVRDINNQQMTSPFNTDSITEQPSIAELTRFVIIWVDRLVSEFPDDADNLAEEADRHARELRGVVQETGSRRFGVGTCPEHGTDDMGQRVPCPGELRAVLRKDDALLPSEVSCSADGEHRWAASEWMQLGRRIIREESA